jgi:uncharacterized membrane protein
VRLLAWAGRIVAFLVIGTIPFLTHAALVSTSPWATWAAIGVSAQVLVLGAFLTWRSRSRYRWPLALLGAVVLVASWQSAHDSLLAVSGVPHALINLGLLALFGGSLLPGRTALITSVARRIDRQLPDRMLAYTRSVTAAWAIFFAAQLLVSLGLFVFAPVAVWSLFVNVLNGPLIALMFLGEYTYRLTHFRDYRHASIPEMVRAFTQGESDPRSSARTATQSTPLDAG